MKRWLKVGAELMLGSRPSLAAVRSIRPLGGVVFAYHNTVTTRFPACGDRSLHLPFDRFIEQIRWLRRTFDIVTLDELFASRGRGRPRAVITFDDAYRGAVRNALPFLIDQGIPATIFVCSGWAGGEVPWWDALATTDGLDDSLRSEVLAACAGRGPTVIDLARRRGLPISDVPADFRIANASDVVRLAENPAVSVGMHGHTHANLCALDDLELREELWASFQETRARFTHAINWLAYPYGLMDDRVATVAREMGFAGALLVDGGPIRDLRHGSRFSVPRVNVPSGLSAAGFRIRSFGLL